MRNRLYATALVIAANWIFLLGGCTRPNLGDDPGTSTPPSGLTYYQDIAPILGAKCTTCHTQGGIAPFALESYDDVKAHAQAIAVAMQARTMPPLPPDQTGCQPLDDDRNMSEDDRMKVYYWAAGPRDAGDAAHPAPIVKPLDQLGAPALTVDSGVDYLSQLPAQDDYRCFVIDPKLAQPFPLVAADTTSTNRSIVHHVIVFAALPQSVAAVQALDAADPGPGYTCFGGAGFAGAIPVSASAVGSRVKPFPEGSGVPLPAGTQFVVQVHYNFDNGRGANRLALKLWQATAPLTQIPHGMLLANTSFLIPAGAPDVEAGADGSFTDLPLGAETSKPGKIWQVFPHMHLLGKSISVELERADGSRQCLINIPGTWDFHWQGSYQFATPVEVQAGDKVHMSCTWDNSAAHQPTVNGQQQQPRDVRFGEGSTDEMCLAGLVLTN